MIMLLIGENMLKNETSLRILLILIAGFKGKITSKNQNQRFMRKSFTMVVIAVMIQVTAFGQKQVVGYYPNWQWYDRNQLVRPESIFLEKYTIINYAFFRPMANGDITSTDSWADENLLLGPMIWWPVQYHDSTKSLPYLAHQAGIKLLPSIGGWNDSGNFPGIAASPAKRQTFISACINLINTYKFDGIDLDWEYPGYSPHGGSPADKQNFTLLLQELRTALNNHSVQTGKSYLLTSCFGAAASHMQHIDWVGILPLVDYVNLMTYDFHGSWDPVSNHHTPLYPSAVGDPHWCFDGAFSFITQTYQVPPQKINLGVAFYGKALANCTQLYGPHSGYDASTFWEDEGQPLYYNIMKRMNQFTRHWDQQVLCPYLMGNTINTFVTFDDKISIGHKAQYVVDHQVAGVIIWEITGDYIETSPGSGVIAGTPLLDTLNQVLTASALQSISMPAGWSGISSHIIPISADVELILQPVGQQLVCLQSDFGIYWPANNINTIGDWNTHHGYAIKLSSSAILTISGQIETNRTLQLTAGWSMIPALSECPVEVNDLLEGVNWLIVKEVAGLSVNWPMMGINTLGTLFPGKSYFLYLENGGEITFPDCNQTK